MKNRLTLTILFAALSAAVLGCGVADNIQKSITEANTPADAANSNKSLTDKAVETAVGDQKIGIPECDDALVSLTEQANNPDDGVIAKALKQTALNQFRERVKTMLEENKADKKQVAAFCKDFKSNFAGSTPEVKETP